MNTHIRTRSPINRFSGDLEQFFDAVCGTRSASEKTAETFVPRLNLWEADEHFVVEAELPGIAPKDVEITLEGRELRIRGERKLEQGENQKQMHRQERVYGQFERTVRFATEVNHEGVEAKSQDGVLTITVKKSEALKPRRIQVS